MHSRTSIAALVLFGCADRAVEDDAGGETASIDCDEPYLPVEANTCEVEPLSPGSGLVQACLDGGGGDFGCLLADERPVAAALSACLCNGAELVGEPCGPWFLSPDGCCYWSLYTSEC